MKNQLSDLNQSFIIWKKIFFFFFLILHTWIHLITPIYEWFWQNLRCLCAKKETVSKKVYGFRIFVYPVPILMTFYNFVMDYRYGSPVTIDRKSVVNKWRLQYTRVLRKTNEIITETNKNRTCMRIISKKKKYIYITCTLFRHKRQTV